MKAKILIGVICFVLGALAGYFGPGIVKAEMDAYKEDSVQEVPEEVTPPELTPEGAAPIAVPEEESVE